MIELNVSGMTCDRCADHVREALEKLPGVQSVEVSYPQRTASVAVDPGDTGLGVDVCRDPTWLPSSTGQQWAHFPGRRIGVQGP